MSTTEIRASVDTVDPHEGRYPFHITKKEERQLRLQGARAVSSLVIGQATSFDEYARQLMIPPAVTDPARQAENLRLSGWEVEAMRKHLAPCRAGRQHGATTPDPGGQEVIKPQRPWKTLSHVELATTEWVDWCNHRRLHGEIGHIPPVEYETNYYRETTKPQLTATN